MAHASFLIFFVYDCSVQSSKRKGDVFSFAVVLLASSSLVFLRASVRCLSMFEFLHYSCLLVFLVYEFVFMYARLWGGGDFMYQCRGVKIPRFCTS